MGESHRYIGVIMPKVEKEYQVSEKSDLYYTIKNNADRMVVLINKKETLVDQKASLSNRKDRIVESNKEHYNEDPYAIQELDAMYSSIDEAYRYWLKQLDTEILELEDKFVSNVWTYRSKFDEKEKAKQRKIHQDFIGIDEPPF
tara:strand:+ start:471 stop:902 length:432 start_codon:yes stop_codon:yes gene_type:complete